eukprot:CAMPEP_0118984338 /NCGR_PEP_ID=MMETSP1173-20130426/37583_1 /TAXON_ID=1034831 /ORGANISM="Rhizochromulina marina cf, Strain CCMP1243" /LENGTH=147 /DNA_ID=CAMNT_0006934993 /DNA_START=61 /DNA_END=500 /DNA_ORIENTATION=-
MAVRLLRYAMAQRCLLHELVCNHMLPLSPGTDWQDHHLLEQIEVEHVPLKTLRMPMPCLTGVPRLAVFHLDFLDLPRDWFCGLESRHRWDFELLVKPVVKTKMRLVEEEPLGKASGVRVPVENLELEGNVLKIEVSLGYAGLQLPVR